MKASILIVEDEPAIADNIVYALETEGFRCRWCSTGREALAALSEAFDLAVLDVGLPDMGGFDLCREIRKSHELPILFLTARAGEIDRVVGLELGADDYVVKPFSPRELAARIKAILRRTAKGNPSPSAPTPAAAASPSPASPLSQGLQRRTGTPASPPPDLPRGSGSPAPLSPGLPPGTEAPVPPLSEASSSPFRVDPERFAIAYFGKRLELSRYEYRLLAALIGRPGRVWSREGLMEKAWDEPESSLDRTVDAHIKSLRAKLRQVRPDVEAIVTHRGLGYSLKEDW